MAHPPMDRPESATPGDALGLTLSLSADSATVALADRPVGGGLRIDHLELELAEVDVPLDLDGGPESFRDRSTETLDLAVGWDLAEGAEWLRSVAGEVGLPADLSLVGEGGHLSLRGRWRPEDPPFEAVLHVLAEQDPGQRGVRVVMEAVLPFGRPAEPVDRLFDGLSGALERVLGGSGPRGLESLERPGIRSLRIDVAEALLWRVFPSHGWKMPSLRRVGLERVQIEPDRMVLTYGTGSRRPPTGPGMRAWAEEQEVPDDAELLVARGRRRDAAELLLGSGGPLSAPTSVLERVLEVLWNEPEAAELRRAVADAARGRSPSPVLAFLEQAVFGPEAGPEAFVEVAAMLRERGLRRAAASALQAQAVRVSDPDAALRLWEDAVCLDPDDPRLLHQVVQRLAAVGRTAAALRATRRLVRLAPERAPAAWAQAGEWFLHADRTAARRLFEQALAIDPLQTRALGGLLRLDALSGDWASGERRLQTVAAGARQPEDQARLASVWALWAQLQLESEQPEAARTAAETALILDPSLPAPWAVALTTAGDDRQLAATADGLQQAFDQVQTTDVAGAGALLTAAADALSDVRPDLARRIFDRLSAVPGLEPVAVFDAATRLGEDRRAQARAQVDACWDAKDLAGATAMVGRLAELAPDPDAVGWVRELAGRKSDDPGWLDAVARLAARHGQSDLELELLQLRLDRWPDPEAAGRLGERLVEGGRVAEALPWLERAVAVPHPGPTVLRAWAEALRATGSPEREAEALVRAAEMAFEPDIQCELLQRLAACQSRSGRDDQALATVRRALAVAPQSRDARRLGVELAIRQGDWPSAEKWGQSLRDEFESLAPSDRVRFASDLARALGAQDKLREQADWLASAWARLPEGTPGRERLRTQLADVLRLAGDREGLARLHRLEAESARGPERAVRFVEAGRAALELGDPAAAARDLEAAAEAAFDQPDLRRRVLDQLVRLYRDRPELRDRFGAACSARWRLEPPGSRERYVLEQVDAWLREGSVDGIEGWLAEAAAELSDAVALAARLGQVHELRGQLRAAAEAYGQAGRRADRQGRVEDAAAWAARAAQLYAQVGDLSLSLHHDRAVLSLSRGPSAAVAESLSRLEDAAREADAHGELVDWLDRRAELFEVDRWRARFEQGLVYAHALDRPEPALEAWTRAEAEAPEPLRDVVWAERSQLLGRLGRHRERVDHELHLAERARDPVRKGQAHLRAARILWNDLDDREAAIDRLDVALRADPASDEARRLRWSWGSESGDPAGRAELLATEARLTEDGDRAVLLWKKAAEAYEAALEDRPDDPSLRATALQTLDHALRMAPQDKMLAQSRVRIGPGPEALGALGLVERHAESAEERWACRTVRAWFKASRPSVPEDVSTAVERVLELLPRLDEGRFVRCLSELGCPVDPADLRGFILDVGLEASAARGDWRRHAEGLVARAETMSDVHLRAELRLRAGHVFEWKVGDAAAAGDEYRAALALSPEHPEAKATLRRFLTDEQRFSDVADQLGVSVLREIWDRIRDDDTRGTLAAGEALFPRMESADPERARVLLRVADLYRRFDDSRDNEVFALEQVVETGAPDAQRDALERLDVLFHEAERPELRAEVLRKLVDRLEAPEVRAARLAELGGILESALGDPGAAETEYRAALALDPACEPARQGLLRRLGAEGRYAEIVDAFGSEGLRELRRAHLDAGDLDGAWNLTEAWERAVPEVAADAWIELAQRFGPDDGRQHRALAHAARGGSVPALDGLRRAWAEATEPERVRELAALLIDLTAGAEEAACATALARYAEDPEARLAWLERALRADPSFEPARGAWIEAQAARGELGAIASRFGVEALSGFIEEGPPPLREAALEVRARASSGPAAAEDWMQLCRWALGRGESELAWRRLERALASGWEPAGDDPVLAELLSAFHARRAPLEPEWVARMLDGLDPDALTADRWLDLARGVLATEGADGLARVADGRPERQRALVEALREGAESLPPRERIEARLAGSRMAPADPSVCAWLDEALRIAAESEPDALERVASPWLELRMQDPDLDRRRAAIEHLRGLSGGLASPELLHASLSNHLEQGRPTEAMADAEALFDAELAPPGLRRSAAERLLAWIRVQPDRGPETDRMAERAWLELSRSDTCEPDERRTALAELVALRERRGAPAEGLVPPLESALSLSAPKDQLPVRRKLRELAEEAGDWATAERHQAVVAERSQAAQDWVELAELRAWLDDPDGVRSALDAAKRRDPASTAVHDLRVRWAERNGDWEEAIAARLDGAADPAASISERTERWLRGVELVARHQPERVQGLAFEGLELFTAGAPEVEAYVERVLPRLAEVDPESVESFVQAALTVWPMGASSAARRLEIAEAMFSRNEFEGARQLLFEGLGGLADPEDPVLERWLRAVADAPAPSQALDAGLRVVRGGARVRLAAARLAAEDPEDALPEDDLVEAFDALPLAPPRWQQTLHQAVQGWTGPQGQRLRQALESRVSARDPLGALQRRADAHLLEGRLEQALAVLEEAERTDPDDPELCAELFRLRVALERYAEADAMLEGRTGLDPDLLRRRGEMVREHLRDGPRGARVLRQAFEADPSFERGRHATDALVESGLYEEALDVGSRVVDLAPSEDRRVEAELGWSAALRGKDELEQALEVVATRPGTEAQLLYRAHLLQELRGSEAAAAVLNEPCRDPTVPGDLERARVRLVLDPNAPVAPPPNATVDLLHAEDWTRALDMWARQHPGEAAHWGLELGLDPFWALQWDPTVLDAVHGVAPPDAESAVRASRIAEAGGDLEQAFEFQTRALELGAADFRLERVERAGAWLRTSALAFQRKDTEAALEALRVARWLDPSLDLFRFRDALESGPPCAEQAELLEQLAADAQGEAAASWLQRASRIWRDLGAEDRALVAEASAYARWPSEDFADLAERCAQAGAQGHLRSVLSAALHGEQLDMSTRMAAARRQVQLEIEAKRPAEALAVAQRGLSIRAPGTDLGLLEVAARLARQSGLDTVELDAINRLGRLVEPDRQQHFTLRRAALLEDRDPDGSLACFEELTRVSRSAAERWARLLRARRPGAEAELWARLASRWTGVRKGAAFSRVAHCRVQDGDRRGARAAWRAAVLACPDDLSYRRGLIEQLVALGQVSDARAEALAAYRKAHDLGRLDAAFTFLFEGIQRTIELGLGEAERGEWEEALQLGVETTLLLSAMVARARDGGPAEELAEVMVRAESDTSDRSLRGQIRLARARLLETVLGRSDEADRLRRLARDEDLAPGAADPFDVAPQLDTTELGVPFSQIPLTSSLVDRAASSEARARATRNPVLRSQVWLAVARIHLERRTERADSARRALDESIRANPVHVQAWADRALLAMQEEDHDGAAEALSRLERLGGPSWLAAELEVRGARVALARRRSSDARRWLDAAERRDPDHLAVARGRVASAEPEDRGPALDGLLAKLEPELDGPELDRTLLERAKVALSQGQAEVARRAVDAVQERSPRIPGLSKLRERVLEAVGAPEHERLEARNLANPDEPEPLIRLLQLHRERSDPAGADRCAEALSKLDDPEGLRVALDEFRARGDADRSIRAIDRLGGVTAAPDADPAEWAAWIGVLSRAGRGADVLRAVAEVDDRGLVEATFEALCPGSFQEIRFWLQPCAELPRDALADPRVRAGLRTANLHFRDAHLVHALADAERIHGDLRAAVRAYRDALRADPVDLRLLDGLAAVAPTELRADLEALESYVRTGQGPLSGTPPDLDGWLWPRAAAVLGSERAESLRAGYEAQRDQDRGTRRRDVMTWVQGPDGAQIPVVRSSSGGFEVTVILGASPHVVVGWAAAEICDRATVRFAAAQALAMRLLSGPDVESAPSKAVGQIARMWGLAQVRDWAAAVRAVARWGPASLLDMPADPNGRSELLRAEPLRGLVEGVLAGQLQMPGMPG